MRIVKKRWWHVEREFRQMLRWTAQWGQIVYEVEISSTSKLLLPHCELVLLVWPRLHTLLRYFVIVATTFFYIATFILYNGWGDVLVQTKLLMGYIGTILGCNFLCKLDCKYCWKISRHRLNTVCILSLSIRKTYHEYL